MNSIIRSIDVGYGTVKYVVADDLPNGRAECKSFPSLAPLAVDFDLSGGTIVKRDTLLVSADGNNYEVGPDVGLALGTHGVRVLHKRFSACPEHLALTRGALAYMSAPRIDLLVVGLPVSLLAAEGQALKQRLEGTHPISPDKSVEVRKALVLAQPIGGLIAYAQDHQIYGRFRDQRNLVIDIGFYTADWLLAKGIQPFSRRCGSYAGGMHAILKRIAQAISEDHGLDFDDLNSLDEGLRTGNLNLFGRHVELRRYLNVTRPIVQEALNAVVNSVGDGRDIDTILVVGGGAQFFSEAIRQRFPSHAVAVSSDPVFYNVRGFQRVGMELMQRRAVEAA